MKRADTTSALRCHAGGIRSEERFDLSALSVILATAGLARCKLRDRKFRVAHGASVPAHGPMSRRYGKRPTGMEAEEDAGGALPLRTPTVGSRRSSAGSASTANSAIQSRASSVVVKTRVR
jgi:hypothetical protein